ncbi:MAG: 4Fe-4S dicluster domain-containing protein [Candidatus Kapaibacterium sp.]
MNAILTDITKCIGCTECVNACKVINNLSPDKPREWIKNDGLSANNWTSVLYNGEHYVRKQCRHCIDPACVSVCPVGALQNKENGAVIYDSDRCLGCRYCMMACPYGIPRYTWDSPVAYVRKCILCYENIKNGRIDQPACTSVCPTGATIFGSRKDLLREAHYRIKNEPDKYMDHVFGEKEVGGSNVLYITSKEAPLDFLFYYNNRLEKDIKLLGSPDPNAPLPETTKWAMGAVPVAFFGMGAIMASSYWMIKRRQKLAEDNKSAGIEIQKNPGEEEDGQDK